MTRASRLRVVVPTALAFLLVACGASNPTPSLPSPSVSVSIGTSTPTSLAPLASPADPIAVYASIAADVERIRGLQPTKAVAPVLVDEAKLRADVETEFDSSNPPEAIAAREAILRALGLLGPAVSLRAASLAFLGGEVAGYYVPEKDALFVVSRSGGVGPSQRATYAHEYTHQLQDQHFDLGALGLDSTDQRDRALARLALVEGDASSVQSAWMQQHLSPAELAALLVEASDPAAIKALQQAPLVLRATSAFPYQDGLAFVTGLVASGGYAAVDAAFARPPDSTEQVLHPAKYVSRESPIAVSFPSTMAAAPGAGWRLVAEDTLGELILRTWLIQGRLAMGVASAASAGWGGDRVGLLAGPGGATVLVLDTRWDSATDAQEFATAASTAVGALGLEATMAGPDASTQVVLALGGTVEVRSALVSALRP